MLEVMRLALQVPVRNPGRSILTVLGLSIGVSAFIAMVSFGEGARSSVVAQFESLGTNLLRVRTRVGRQDPKPPRPLTDADVQAIRREATSVAHVVPIATRPADLAYGGNTHRLGLHGTSPEFIQVRGRALSGGGMFDEADMRERAKVCVLGMTPVRALFFGRDPLGETLMIDGRLPCRIIGVLEEQGNSISGTDLDSIAILPATTYTAVLGNPNGYASIEVQPSSAELLEAAREELTEILRRSHRIEPGDPNDFDLSSPDEVTRVAERTSAILTALLAGIAAVSLLVGGIGIMNILLVSVAERTHEIGIRAAIGASPRQILTQFLAEAFVLSCIGSGAGAALGALASTLVATKLGFVEAVSLPVVLGSLLFGVGVGTLFGYIPARRAAMLDPIQALRRE